MPADLQLERGWQLAIFADPIVKQPDDVNLERLAHFVGEDEAVIRPGRARLHSHFELAPSVFFERLHEVRRERDGSQTLLSLRRRRVPDVCLAQFERALNGYAPRLPV